MLFLRSALFLAWFVVVSVAMNVICLPALVLPKPAVFVCASSWARLVFLGLSWCAGIKVEVRGTLPEGPVLVASKHQSMWETVAFLLLLKNPAIVLKRSLLNVPLYGWYCRKMKMIAIDREAGGMALKAMTAAARQALSENRPVVIFPEGTRKAPGSPPDYKPGVAALYSHLQTTCVPVALNSGLFWRGIFYRCPGTIVLEFLPPIPPGLSRQEFMTCLETRIEEATNRLVAAAARRDGGRAP